MNNPFHHVVRARQAGSTPSLSAALPFLIFAALCAAPQLARSAETEKPAAPKLSEIKPEANPDAPTPAPKTPAPKTPEKKPTENPALGHAFDGAASALDKIAPIGTQTAALATLLENLKKGEIMSEVAFQNGQLNGAQALELLADTTIGTLQYRPLVSALAAIVASKAPELIADVEKVTPQAKVRLAPYFLEVRDPRAVPFYESIIAALAQPPSDKAALPVFKLSDYYAAIGDYKKAAETRLRMKDYTTSPQSLANSEVEAARFYRKIGEEGKAEKLYEGASRHGYGWATGLAIYDQASALVEQNRHEEARKLLNTPISGQYVEHITAALWSLLARSYFETDEWAEAERYAKQAIELSQSMELLKREGLEAQIESARMVLQRIGERRTQGILAVPNRVRWMVRSGERPVRQWLKIQSITDAPLQITTTDERIEIEVMPQVHQRGELFEREVALKLKDATQSFATTLKIHGAQQTDALLQVSVAVEVAP